MSKLVKLSILFLMAMAAGALTACHAQAPPTTHSVALTWTAPANTSTWTTPCGTATGDAACTYLVSRIVVAAGTSTCPTPNVTTPNYTVLNTSSPASGTTYTDTAAMGETVCYVVQTEQSSTIGQPSNTAGPFVVPAQPGAPTIGGNVAQVGDAPAVPMPAPSEDNGAPGVVLYAKVR